MNKGAFVSTLVLLVAAFAAASVFAYYPFQLTVAPVSPPVIFDSGSNANQADLGVGNTISIILGANNASVEVTIYPTYHTTYYKNVTLLKNIDSKAYNVSLILDQMSSELPSESNVTLIVFSKDVSRDLQPGYPEPGLPSGSVNAINLMEITTNSPQLIGQLNGNSIWEFDFMVQIPEGTSIGGASATFKMHIVYTPSSETPP